MNDTYILKISSLMSYFDSTFNGTNGTNCLKNEGEAGKPITTLAQWMTSQLVLPGYQDHNLRQALYLEIIFHAFGHSSLNQWDSCEKNVWCTENIVRRIENKNYARVINILHIEKEKKFVNTEIAKKYETDTKEVGLWYHGTETTSLKKIIENNLMLKECFRPTDFARGSSGGFYVSPHLSAAQKWANQKTDEKKAGSPVVIVFNIDTTLEDGKYLCLNLYGKKNKQDWTTIVKHFRCQNMRNRKQKSDHESYPVSGPLSIQLKECDYIIGPMHGDGRGGTPRTDDEWLPSVMTNSHQLCVKTKKLLDIFNKSIESIIIGS